VTNDAQIKASDFPASSVDSEISLFSGTTGKAQKRATGSGLVTATSGVYSVTTVGAGLTSSGGTLKTTDGWTYVYISVGAGDFTTANTTLTVVSSLTTPTLTLSTLYEFKSCLYVVASADTNGMRTSFHSAGNVGGIFSGYGTLTTASAAAGATTGGAGFAGDSNTYNTTSGGLGILYHSGFFTTAASGSPVLWTEVRKVTAGTVTVKIGSWIAYKVAGAP
jgi:hypothetical protein